MDGSRLLLCQCASQTSTEPAISETVALLTQERQSDKPPTKEHTNVPMHTTVTHGQTKICCVPLCQKFSELSVGGQLKRYVFIHLTGIFVPPMVNRNQPFHLDIPVHCPTSLQQTLLMQGIRERKKIMIRAIPLVGQPGLIRKCQSRFPQLVPLVSGWSVWHNGKQPWVSRTAW